MRVIVHSREPKFTDYLAVALTDRGVPTEPCLDGPGEFTSLLYREPEAVGVVTVPTGMDGILTCLEMRLASVQNLIMVLVEKRAIDPAADATGRARVLAAGADDVQPAHIDIDELVARVKAIGRRMFAADEPITFAGCIFIPDSGWLHSATASVHLTKLEAKVLLALHERANAVLSKDALFGRVWGDDPEPPAVKIIDVVVCKLRRKLYDILGGRDVIETSWGRGYRFVPEGFEPAFDKRRARAAG